MIQPKKTVKKTVKTNPDSGGVAPFQSKKDVGPQPPKPKYVGGSPAKTGTIIPKKKSVSKNIGNLNKAKSGKSFPDLNKDGKVTKADVLKGRGVIAKSGKSMKTCKGGC